MRLRSRRHPVPPLVPHLDSATGARADVHPCTEAPPAPYVPQPGAEEAVLRRVVDDLAGTAEALWWEAQCASAELAAAVTPEPRLGRSFGYG
jgi:hypothetical protein